MSYEGQIHLANTRQTDRHGSAIYLWNVGKQQIFGDSSKFEDNAENYITPSGRGGIQIKDFLFLFYI